MGKNKPYTFDGSKYSAWHVLETANAYYALSKIFTDSWARVPLSDDDPPIDMHESVASATNRILALELYIKALLIGAQLQVPKEHNLVILFNAIPEGLRQAIKQQFERYCEADPGQMSIGVESSFKLVYEEVDEFQFPDKTQELDPSLEGLLERNKDGFVASRYLFQNARHDRTESYLYEYPRLALICSILCETLEGALRKRPSTYQRTFVF